VSGELVAKALAIAIAFVSSRAKSQDKRYSSISSQSITVSFLRRPGRLRLLECATLGSSVFVPSSVVYVISLLFPKKHMGYVTISDGVLLSS